MMNLIIKKYTFLEVIFVDYTLIAKGQYLFLRKRKIYTIRGFVIKQIIKNSIFAKIKDNFEERNILKLKGSFLTINSLEL